MLIGGLSCMDSKQEVTRLATAAHQAVCTACGSDELECFFTIPQTPLNCVVLRATRETALNAPTGRIELDFCAACGGVSNVAFDPNLVDYDQSYDNSLHFSPTFRKYADRVARDLVERYNLRGKNVIDLGCGNAEFLTLICALGDNRGVGFDPSFIQGRSNLEAGKGVAVIQDYYSERYAGYAADFVICRHVLEHIPNPKEFLHNVRGALRGHPEAAIFFELPNASFVFQKNGIWDILYEHCFYYGSGALARLFSTCGFDVLNVSETFDGQYLCLEGRLSSRENGLPGDAAGDLDSLRGDILRFADAFRCQYAHWKKMLDRFAGEGKRVVLWGAGAKGAMFLNAMGHVSSLEYVVDVNPHKCGLYIPGTGQEVVRPEFLKQYRPDVLLLANPNYRDEISRHVAALDIAPELLSI
jgi:SAM-dependent methyltransferase